MWYDRMLSLCSHLLRARERIYKNNKGVIGAIETTRIDREVLPPIRCLMSQLLDSSGMEHWKAVTRGEISFISHSR